MDELLAKMHSALGEELLRRIRSGEAKPQDLAVAARFLKDNGISATISASPNLEALTKAIEGVSFAGPDDLFQ